MVKARLESITFGHVVTEYIELPDCLFKEQDLVDSCINYLLQVSKYRKHINEVFDIHTKVE